MIVFENIYKKIPSTKSVSSNQCNEWQITEKCQTKWRCLRNLIGASIKSLPPQTFFVPSQTKLNVTGIQKSQNMKLAWSSVFYHWIRIYGNKYSSCEDFISYLQPLFSYLWKNQIPLLKRTWFFLVHTYEKRGWR